MGTLSQHAEIQAIAKAILVEIGSSIDSTDSEETLASRAITLLAGFGIVETWYYDCPALVLLGSRSCLSVSGRDYVPSKEPVGQFNLVTVDLSPLRNGIWGDCARTFVVENGACTTTPFATELRQGIEAEVQLHKAIRSFVSPNTTFEELFAFGNAEITRLGFENLDYLNNLGHSIATRREDRLFIEQGNSTPLSTVSFFTFEPHIRQINATWGFKHEDVYYFDSEQRLRML